MQWTRTCSVPPKPLNFLASPNPHSLDGMLQVLLRQFELPEINDYMMLPRLSIPLKFQRKSYCIQELVVENNPTTSRDRFPSCEKIYLTNIPDRNMLKSKTSAQESTSKDQDCYAFWNSSYKELYQLLSWLPKTDFVGSGSNSWNGCVATQERKSWFYLNRIQPLRKSLEKTSWLSSKFTVVDGMGEGGTEKPTSVTKALKLRLRPTKEQQKILEQWSHSARCTYNHTIAALNNRKDNVKNKFKLRNRFVTYKSSTGKINNFFNNKQYLLECPKAIRFGAVMDAITARKAALSNYKKGNIKHFKMQFRTRKKQDRLGWSLTVEKNNLCRNEAGKLTIFEKSLGEIKYWGGSKQLNKLLTKEKKLKNSVNFIPEADCKLQKDKFGDYYLVVPITVNVRPEPKSKGVVAGDPGIRKWFTFYSPDKEESLIVGDRFMTTLWPLLFAMDKLESQASKEKSGSKLQNEIKTKIAKIRKRLMNLKRELQCQTANLLTNEYSTLLIPKLDTTKLVSSPKGLKNKSTRREMMNTNHCTFFSYLKNKCVERGVKMMEVAEHYTSQTCHLCGTLHKTSSETRTCPKCGYKGDRDVIGALNILLRAVRCSVPHF